MLIVLVIFVVLFGVCFLMFVISLFWGCVVLPLRVCFGLSFRCVFYVIVFCVFWLFSMV